MFKRIVLILVVVVIAAPLIARLLSYWIANGRVYNEPQQVAHHRVAIVFGASVRNGAPSAMLYDRVASAVDLYKAGAVDKLLMSGDNRFVDYNEAAVMRRTAMQLGVPERDIVLDLAGRSTYETCYRAKAIFGLDEAVLVTQRFHLDRALMTCDGLGLRSVGYAADRRDYLRNSIWWSTVREIPATLNAFINVYVTRPLPVLGDQITIN